MSVTRLVSQVEGSLSAASHPANPVGKNPSNLEEKVFTTASLMSSLEVQKRHVEIGSGDDGGAEGGGGGFLNILSTSSMELRSHPVRS